MKRARTQEDKDRRRGVILDAALHEFFDKGFRAARMEDIAARAAFTKGTLYLYFQSKDALFRAIIEHLATPNLEQFENITASAGTFSEAVDGLAQFAPVMLRETDMPRLMKVLIGDSQNFPDIVRAYRRNVLERLFAAVAQLLTRARDAGEVDFEDAELTARLVLAPIAFSGMWQALFGNDPGAAVDLDGLFRQHARNLRRALVVS